MSSSVHPDAYAAQVDKEIIRRSKEAPEIQIHVAVTFVLAGEPHGKTPFDRRDKVWEAGQYAVKIEPHQVGNLKQFHIDASMKALRDQVVGVLRRCGGLKAGE